MTTKHEHSEGGLFVEVFIRRPVMATMLVAFLVTLAMFVEGPPRPESER